MQHDAFISYSRKDRAFAVCLHKALQRYRPPRGMALPQRHLDIFRDEDDFTGADYYQALDSHLDDSAKLIVLCSPAARASAFVNDEIRRFALSKGPQHIIALLVAGIPNNEARPGQEGEMAFPQALCDVLEMPLAPDYRRFDPDRGSVDRGSHEASWYTTLANLYDVSRAEIEQRDRKRRVRRLWLNLGFGGAAVAVLAGLTVALVWWQRKAAEEAEMASARLLTDRSVAAESLAPAYGLRVRALLAAESLRHAWTDEAYAAWQRAIVQMAPVLARIETHAPMIRLAFSHDRRKLVTLCGERHVHLYSLDGMQELGKVQALATAYHLAIDASGDRALAYHSDDETLQIADLRSGTMNTLSLPGSLRSAAFGPSGDIVVASATHRWIVNPADGAIMRTLPGQAEVQPAPTEPARGDLPFLDKPPPGRPLATTITSPSGRHAAGSLADGGYAVVDLRRPRQSLRDREAITHLTLADGWPATNAAFSNDDTLLALSSSEAGGQRSELQLVSLQPARWRLVVPQRSRNEKLAVLPPDARVVTAQREPVATQVFSADGRPVAVDGPAAMQASPSGRFTARLGEDKTWIVTDVGNGRTIEIPANGSPLEFSPDERRVLVFPRIHTLDKAGAHATLAEAGPLYRTWTFPGSNLVIGRSQAAATHVDQPSILFDWSTDKMLRGPGSVDDHYAVAPDGRHYATYDHQDGIRIWSVGDKVPSLSGKANAEWDQLMTFSPDGSLLALGGCNRSAAVYRTHDLQLHSRVRFDRGCLVGFSVDGKYVVSSSSRAGIPEPALHPITVEGVLAETCAKVQASLTQREWARFGAGAVARDTCADHGSGRLQQVRRWVDAR